MRHECGGFAERSGREARRGAGLSRRSRNGEGGSKSRRSQDAGEKAVLNDSRAWDGARRNLMLDSGRAKADCYGMRLDVEGTFPRRNLIEHDDFSGHQLKSFACAVPRRDVRLRLWAVRNECAAT